MLRHLYIDERSRTRPSGWSAVAGLASSPWASVGGTLIGMFLGWDWRAIFWFNPIIGVLALLAALFVLPET